MSAASAILAELSAADVNLRADGADLIVEGPGPHTNCLRCSVRKPALLDLLELAHESFRRGVRRPDLGIERRAQLRDSTVTQATQWDQTSRFRGTRRRPGLDPFRTRCGSPSLLSLSRILNREASA
jgi:hypothetical protein